MIGRRSTRGRDERLGERGSRERYGGDKVSAGWIDVKYRLKPGELGDLDALLKVALGLCRTDHGSNKNLQFYRRFG